MGNLASVKNALNFLKIPSKIVDCPKDLVNTDKIILPGVGAFGMAMLNLESKGFIESLENEVLIKQKPLLGICLGMQLLLSKSYEFGENKGLDFIKGEVRSFSDKINDLPIPHMGWNNVKSIHNSLLRNITDEEAIFYFIHSFYCELENNKYQSGETDYGFNFTSMIEKENIFGAQFHPEKSQKFGLEIFTSFHKI